MIGIFDSGFGGLHVLRGVVEKLPDYDFIYVGDNARTPYGSRSAEEVYSFAKQGVAFLFSRGARIVIVACNTASSEALREIQREYVGEREKKVLGVLIPFAETAVAATRTKRIGIIATEGTVRSKAFVREIHKIDPSIEVIQQACPLLVPLIERGEIDSEHMRALLGDYLEPFSQGCVDTLILGCTHYGIIEEKIRMVINPAVQLIVERDVVPPKLMHYLIRHPEIDASLTKAGSRTFYATGDTHHFETLAATFYGVPLQVEKAHLL